MAVIAFLLAAGPAAARTGWFGSNLYKNQPANAGSSCASSGLAPTCTHIGSYYPGTTGHARAPFKGTVFKVQVRAESPMRMQVEIVRVRHVASNFMSGQAKATTRSRMLTVHGPTSDQASNGIYPVESFRVKLKAHKGQELAIVTKHNTAEYCSDGTPGQLTFYNPFLKPGRHLGFRNSTGVDECLMLVRARIRSR